MKPNTRTTAVIAAATLAALLAAAPAARAVGIGVYGTAGGGSADWQTDGRDGFDDRRATTHTGAGLVLDTASPASLLNYRLSLGWERVAREAAFGQPGFSLQGAVVDQDLTVTIVGGPGPLRVWAGPELRLGFMSGRPDGDGGPKEDFLALGIGPVIGFDFAVGPAVAVSWKLGYLVTGYAGSGRSSFTDHNDASLGEGHAYVSLAILFNTWGSYPGGYPGRPESRPNPYQRRW